MTRLDASSEPSMEDILASIRKIIAEEPPGSRPVPPLSRAPEPVAPSPFGRAFLQREPQFSNSSPSSEFATRSGSSDAPDFDYPTLSMPARGQAAGTSSARTASNGAAEVRDESPVRSVEDQLSDLLGDDPTPAASPDVRPSTEHRSGFTVSRDGYVPGQAGNDIKGDPFDFDIGPSPFEVKAKAADVADAVSSAVESVARLGSALPGYDVRDQSADEPATPVEPEPDDDAETELDQALGAEPQNAAPVAPIETAAPAAGITREVKFVTPSIAATLGPLSLAANPDRHGEPSSANNAPKPASSGKAPRQPEVSLAVLEPMSFASEAERDFMRDTASAVAAAEPAHLPPAVQIRSMEDTVADLLRPMLKNWLAENMPKIVERALRREMSEQHLSEHKTAAE